MRFNTFFLNVFYVSSTAAFVPDGIRVHVTRRTAVHLPNDNNRLYLPPPPLSFSIQSNKSHLLMAKRERGTRVVANAPILKNWSKNADGSITANIFNSPDFRNNEKVTTSRIVEKTLKSGQLVTSVAGSKYRLEGNEFQVPGKKNGDVQKKGTFSIGNKANIGSKGTFSVQNAKFGPKGIPTLRKWKQNSDGSISGRIFGSKGFKENEFVTTSSMMGDPVANSVARTTSGSRYYLEGNGILAKKAVTRSTGTRSVKGESNDIVSILSGVLALAVASFFGINVVQGPSVNSVVGASVSGDADPSVTSLSTNGMRATTSAPPAPVEYKLETREQQDESVRIDVGKRENDRAVVDKDEGDTILASEDVEQRNEMLEAERLRVANEKKEKERLKALELERLKVEEEMARAKVDQELEESVISSQVQGKDSEFGVNPSTRNVLSGIGATAALSVAVAVSVANQKNEYGGEQKETTPSQSPSPVSTQKDLTPVAKQPKWPTSSEQSPSSGKLNSEPSLGKLFTVNNYSSSESSATSRDELSTPQPTTGTSQTVTTNCVQDIITSTTTSTTTRSTSRSSFFVGESLSKKSATSTNNTGKEDTRVLPTLDENNLCSIEKSTETKIEASVEQSVESYCEKFVAELCDKMKL